MSGRDCQRSRVYRWERQVVAPRDRSLIPRTAAQPMVDAIWAEMGLAYPPRVESLPTRFQARLADADRLTIRLAQQVPSWCLLHEIAHAMTMDHDGRGDGHGPIFMGVYLQLLSRYMRLDAAFLQQSLREAAIAVQLQATPIFAD